MSPQRLLKFEELKVTLDDFLLLAKHETNALEGHYSAIHERIAVARKARSLSELLRDQMDLLHDTRARFKRDHQFRLQLLNGLGRKLRRA